jgi:ATP-dependent Clp protease ATP-binding subunit ClpA
VFERYTERARRVIFFARYEASQFGSTTIETEHLLLGLLREDNNLASRLLKQPVSIASIRSEVENRSGVREKVSTSIDLPLSDECKRILGFANQEMDLLKQTHIGTEHLLLGILREEKCVAAEILHGRGLRLEAMREEIARSDPQETSSTAGMMGMHSGFLTGFTAGFSLFQSLKFHHFDTSLEHAMKAWGEQRQHNWITAQSHLHSFLETLSAAVIEKAGDPKLLDGFAWESLLGELRTGLTSDEDINFRFRLTMLFGEVMMKRLEQRLNS